MARINTSRSLELTEQQRTCLNTFIEQYTRITKKSKQFAQQHRSYMSDPRAVSGFNPVLKELVYPIVVEQSSGSKLRDIDGNEYVDLTCGFGSNFFGYYPPFIKKAIEAQLKKGIEIGPQHPLSGEVARLICEITGHERSAFCNTGSEAVLGAMRIARTVTGRNKIAIFAGSYHGINDEVVVRAGSDMRSVPAASGIMTNSVENILVLKYDSPESLQIIKSQGNELAAVMVEAVQSRQPDIRPKEFLHELRRITQQTGCALIVDEIITGFRVQLDGAQGYFGVKGDLATYGKVIGGGFPIGVIAGKTEYMDALDGGLWHFGDTSFPEVGVTYFAGTFVRHPLALAAAKACLDYLKEKGPNLQKTLNEKTDRFVEELNDYFVRSRAPLNIVHFGSMCRLYYLEDTPYEDLIYYWLRGKGVHILAGFNFYLTLAHSEEDIAFLVKAIKQCVEELQRGGFLISTGDQPIDRRQASADKAQSQMVTTPVLEVDRPPIADARLGRDPSGVPAWYIPDPKRPGKFLKVATKN